MPVKFTKSHDDCLLVIRYKYAKQTSLYLHYFTKIWIYCIMSGFDFHLSYVIQNSLPNVYQRTPNKALREACVFYKEVIPGVDFTKGFKTWHKFSTEIRFMLIPIIVLFIAHEFITGKI